MIIEYAEFLPETGEIISWARAQPPQDLQRWVPNPGNQNLSQMRVNLETLAIEPKTTWLCEISSSVCHINSDDGIIISNIPENTLARITLPGGVRHNVWIQDTSLEIESEVPGGVRVIFWHGLYIIPTIEAEFI